MKKSFILVIFVFLLVASCQKHRSGWQGTVEVIDGVETIKNPEEPLYGGDVLSLEDDLSIGTAAGDDEYVFSRIGGMDVDDEGNIYVIDSSSAHVRVFDSRGRFLRAIGRKGQGPGEFQMPLFVQATSQGELAVFDYQAQQLVFFSQDGTYLRQVSAVRMRYPLMPVRMDSKGNIVGVQVMFPPPIGGLDIAKYNPGLELLFTVARIEPDKDRQERVFELAKPELVYAVSPNDTIVWGNSNVYELYILSPDGTQIKTIQKKYERLPITAGFREKYEKELSELVAHGFRLIFPDHFPAFMDVSFDQKDWLWVRTYEQLEGEEEHYSFDVFDSDGKYLARVPMRVNLNPKSVWKNNSLYTIETAQEGYQIIKRFKVIWRIPDMT